MKKVLKTVIWIVVILLAALLILHGFLGKNARQRQEGTVYYLKDSETSEYANALYRAQANTKDEQLVYTHEGKSPVQNQKILGYYFSPEENLVYFVALKENNAGELAFGLYTVPPSGGEASFVRDMPEFDGSGPFEDLKTPLTLNGKTLLNDHGNLCLREGDDVRTLKKYSGIYHKETSPGYVPIGFTPDGNYALYTPKVSSSDFLRKINAFLTEKLFGKKLGEDIYIVDVRDHTSSRYMKDAYDFQFVR